MRETALKFLSRAAFEEFAREHPEVYQNLMKVLATRLCLTDETVAAGSFLSLKGRVARTLLELAEVSISKATPHALDLSIMIKNNMDKNGSAAFSAMIIGARRFLSIKGKPCSRVWVGAASARVIG